MSPNEIIEMSARVTAMRVQPLDVVVPVFTSDKNLIGKRYTKNGFTFEYKPEKTESDEKGN